MVKVRLLKIAVFLPFLSILAVEGFGQTCCTGGVPMLGGFVAPEVNKNKFGLHLTYSYNYNNDLISNNEVINDSFINRKVSTALLQTDYAITDRWSVSFVLPYIWQTETVQQPTQEVSYPNDGIGDIALWGQYKRQWNATKLSVAVGVKAPTGNTNQRDNASGILFPFSLQNGSGSWDIGLNVQSSVYLGESRKFSLENRIAGKINTKGKTFDAHPDYRFGHQAQWLTGLSYHLLLYTLVTDLYSGVVYQYRAKDAFSGDFPNENTGGHWGNFMLGSNIYINPKFHIGLSGMIPVYRNIHGLQLSTSWQMSTSLNYKL